MDGRCWAKLDARRSMQAKRTRTGIRIEYLSTEEARGRNEIIRWMKVDRGGRGQVCGYRR